MKIMICYVDGSWKPSYPDRVGGAAIIVNDNDTTEELMFYRDNKELAKIRNVAGELISAMEIVKIAVDRGYDKIQIFYDYEGIEKWYDSSWKCKNQYTKAYKEYMTASKLSFQDKSLKYFDAFAAADNAGSSGISIVAKFSS